MVSDKKLAKLKKKMEAIEKQLDSSVDKVKEELKEEVKEESPKDCLMREIGEDIIKFQRESQKGITTQKRNHFIDQQLKKINRLRSMDISMNDKILMLGAERALRRMKHLPIKK